MERESELFEFLEHLDRKLERIMGDLTALNAAIADGQSADAGLLAALNTTLTDLAAEVAALQAAQGTSDQAAIDAATANVAQIVTDLKNATAQVTAADPGAQPAPTAPAAPAAPAEPAAPTGAEGNVDATPPGTPTA